MWNEENRTIFLIKKRERKREWFRPHPHAVRTDRRTERTERTDGRSAPGGASLAAFHVWGVLIPTFHLMPPFWPFFIPFQKACFCRVLPTVLNVTVSNQVSGTVPVLPPCFSVRDLFPDGQVDDVYWTKPKTVEESVRISPVLCAMAINNGDKRSVLLIGRYMPIYWQYPNAIST